MTYTRELKNNFASPILMMQSLSPLGALHLTVCHTHSLSHSPWKCSPWFNCWKSSSLTRCNFGVCIKERKGSRRKQKRGNFRNYENVSALGNNPTKT